MENQTIKMKILREKYLKSMLSNYFLKARNIPLELKKRKLKERQKNYSISQLSCLKIIWISSKNTK